jgi:predicted nucleic acid-binding protein
MKLAYLDSSVWITRVEGLPIYREIISDALDKLRAERWLFCTSDATLLEVLPKPYRDKCHSIITVYNKLFEQARILKSFPNVFEDALIIAQNENLKAMDAIHVSIAFHHGCKRFVSTDSHFNRIYATLPKKLLKKLNLLSKT